MLCNGILLATNIQQKINADSKDLHTFSATYRAYCSLGCVSLVFTNVDLPPMCSRLSKQGKVM